MKALSLLTLTTATITALLIYSVGCGGDDGIIGPCPSADDPGRISMSTTDFQHAQHTTQQWDTSLKEADDYREIYMRITSEDLVEVVFERDGEVVVETYAATNTEVIENWKE